MKDYIPLKNNNLIPWSDNLKEKIGTYAEVLELTPDEVKLVQNSYTAIDKGITVFKAANAAARKASKNKKSMIRKSEGYSPSIGEDLNIIGSNDSLNPDVYKTKLSAKVLLGKVCIRFIKKEVEGVNIYSRLNGSYK